ncbi:hypothetical protein [Burkholderia gladioli]|uniref:hypothetical protein n=1 Tax=Burkholderia gladioli TaxID=28095 RepID=UPI0034DB6A55
MKTTILADGTLCLRPETELEAYALNQWARSNLACGPIPPDGRPKPNIIIDCSEYVGMLEHAC